MKSNYLQASVEGMTGDVIQVTSEKYNFRKLENGANQYWLMSFHCLYFSSKSRACGSIYKIWSCCINIGEMYGHEYRIACGSCVYDDKLVYIKGCSVMLTELQERKWAIS